MYSSLRLCDTYLIVDLALVMINYSIYSSLSLPCNFNSKNYVMIPMYSKILNYIFLVELFSSDYCNIVFVVVVNVMNLN